MKNKHIPESVTKIFFTKEYSMFKIINGNRDVSSLKVNKIVKSINNGNDLTKYCPIIVDEEMNIIDGQHRFHACKKLGKDIHFVVMDKEILLEGIADMNCNTDKWKMADFLNCYFRVGLPDYISFKKFIDKYDFLTYSTAITLLANGPASKDNGTQETEKFKTGKFFIKHLDFASKIADTALKYQPVCDEWSSRTFIVALITLTKSNRVPHAEIIAKIKDDQHTIKKCVSFKEYLGCIEELYNFKTRIRKILY